MDNRYHPILFNSLCHAPKKWCLKRLHDLNQKLNSPAQQYATVHVAGTNGKGSVATKIAKALQYSGRKVGLYSSPHIACYRERIQINGEMISQEASDRLLRQITASAHEKLSYFELLTLLAFCYFTEQKVDCAVIEAGLGGRLDATNLVKPVLSIITSISIDHAYLLGDALDKIAFEKAGIIKKGVPTLLGPRANPLSVFASIAKERDSPLFQLEGSFSHYEEENRALAAYALSLLPFPIERKFVLMGLESCPPCRFEQVLPNVILDVAHNPDGLQQTLQRFFATHPDQKLRVLVSLSKDKEIEKCLTVLQEKAQAVHVTHSDHERLAKLGEPFSLAFEKAYGLARQNKEMLLVCGSFFIMEQARAAAKAAWEQRDD